MKIRITAKHHRGARADRAAGLIFLCCGMAAAAAILAISVYMVRLGGPAIAEIGILNFLLGTVWAPTAQDPQFGILPMILTSLVGTVGAVLLGGPVGVLTAVFLSRAASPRNTFAVGRKEWPPRLLPRRNTFAVGRKEWPPRPMPRRNTFAVGRKEWPPRPMPRRKGQLIRAAVELLADIPSVIYGLIGMTVLVPAMAKFFGLASGATLLTAILVLAVMILPTVISLSEAALDSVPHELYEAALALGASPMQAVFDAVLPAARGGIAGGIILAAGRALGETMAVMMVSGNVAGFPNLFKSARFLTAGVAAEMGYAAGLHREALFSAGLVLFCLITIVNLILNRILRKK